MIRTAITAWMLVCLSMTTFALQTPDAALPATEHVRTEMLVSTEWLEQHLHDPDLVLLCVSANDGSCSSPRIPGSRTILLSDITVTRDDIPNELAPVSQLKRVFETAGVSDASRVVLYGDRYGILAARAYFTLDYLGLADRAALLDGGIQKWRSERRPQSAEKPHVKPGTVTVQVNESVLVTTSQMVDLSHSVHPPLLLDARPQTEYSGARLSEAVSKAGHIPGAKHLFWMDAIVSREKPVLRPEAELRGLFLDAGAAAGSDIVTYCRTGMQSSFTYFIAKYLGYRVSMYDASFFEWSLDDLPAELSPRATAAH